MGQKVRPIGFRTGIMVDCLSQWYASKQDFSELLVEDFKIRRFVKKRYGSSGISKMLCRPNCELLVTRMPASVRLWSASIAES